MFNVAEGVIAAEQNYSPDHQIIVQELEGVQAPSLKQWSDLVFLDWQELWRRTGQTERNVEHFFRGSIENEDTLRFIRAARNGGDPNGPEQRPPVVCSKHYASLRLWFRLIVM